MSYTRAKLEAILVRRLSKLMVKAGFAVTFAGSNADLNDPIGWGLRQAGYTVTDASAVTDADVAAMADSNLDKVLDFAEYRTLESILGNLDSVDVKLGPRAESLSQLAKQVQERLNKLAEKLADLYGYNAPSLESGLLIYEFAEHTEDET